MLNGLHNYKGDKMLQVHVKNFGQVSILCLQGRIVNGNTVALRTAADSQSEAKTLILDLTEVSTIDAAGLGAMLELYRQTKSRGASLRLMNPNQFVDKVLQITRLNTVFERTSAEQLMSDKSLARTASWSQPAAYAA